MIVTIKKNEKMKNLSLVFFLFFMILSCKKDDNLKDNYSNLIEFNGRIESKTELWKLPEFNYQESIIHLSQYNDSSSYSFQIFCPSRSISLYTKYIKASEFNTFFKKGKYNLGIDYNIVLTIDNVIYNTNQTNSDSIELVQITQLSQNKILCFFNFECNLYKFTSGDYYNRIENGNLIALFEFKK